METIPFNTNRLKEQLDLWEVFPLGLVSRVIPPWILSFQNQKELQKEVLSSELLRRLVAIQYRLEGQFGGLDREMPTEEHKAQLEEIALFWRQNRPLEEKKSLSSLEKKLLYKAAHYPVFMRLLFKDKALQNTFFLWTLQDHMDPEVFIEYPVLQEKIVFTGLSSRLGRIGSHLLRIERGENKKVTLLMENKYVNILEPGNYVTFRGSYRLSIEEIFDIFSRKLSEVGNLEVFSEGIVNWNSHRLGFWNAKIKDYELINLNQKNWWTQLPVLEVATISQLKKRYGYILDGKNWNVSAVASRGTTYLHYEDNHAFFEVAIPLGSGLYTVFDLGKYALRLPKSKLDAISYFCHTVRATLAYPDDNIYLLSRQFTYQSFELSHELGLKLMEKIKRDIQRSREGQFIYQIASENCAKWTLEILQELLGSKIVPHLYYTDLLDTTPTGLMGVIFNLIKSLPTWLQLPVFLFFHAPLRPDKGLWVEENGEMVYKSLKRHAFWKTGKVYLPAYLFVQQKMKLFSKFFRLPLLVSRFYLKFLKKNHLFKSLDAYWVDFVTFKKFNKLFCSICSAG